MRARRLILTPILGALMLTGCSTGGDAGFCGPLLENSETAAVAFAPLIPGTNTSADAQKRLELVESLEPTAELSDDLDVWTRYLETAVDAIDDDPDAVLSAHDDEAESAGAALLDHYTGVCLR